jgi:hypothetical protein
VASLPTRESRWAYFFFFFAAFFIAKTFTSLRKSYDVVGHWLHPMDQRVINRFEGIGADLSKALVTLQ